MVSSTSTNNGNKNNSEQLNLNEWIKNLKSKRLFKKRNSRGSDLRSQAILQFALLKNQKILHQKQKERSEKWLKMKRMLEESQKSCDNDEISEESSYNLENIEREQRRSEIRMIWKEDLSDIDSFMNSLDSIKTTLVR
jgi:selenocysteine-specific translation elongation factor